MTVTVTVTVKVTVKMTVMVTVTVVDGDGVNRIHPSRKGGRFLT